MDETYRLYSQHLSVTSVTAWHPDVGFPSEPVLDFAVRVQMCSVVGFVQAEATAETLAATLELERFRDLLARGEAVAGGGHLHNGPDTAIGRFITALEVEHVRHDVSNGAQRAVASMNHYGGATVAPLWNALLAALGAAVPSPTFGGKLQSLLHFIH